MLTPELLRRRIADVDDGELTAHAPTAPFSVIGPPARASCIIYTTKVWATTHLLELLVDGLPCGLVGRGGLPANRDIAWIRNMVGDRNVYFLGDADPFGMLEFTWLNLQLPMSFLGVADKLVDALGVPLTDSLTISWEAAEVRAMALLQEVCPDYTMLIGPRLTNLWQSRRKLEIEAIVSYRTKPVSELLPLLQ